MAYRVEIFTVIVVVVVGGSVCSLGEILSFALTPVQQQRRREISNGVALEPHFGVAALMT